MISLTGEYALRAIVCLASNPGKAQTAEMISQATDVPVGYLAKIMQHLTRTGMVASQRGPHGGFSLLLEPTDISLFDVIAAVDQVPRLHDPPTPDGDGSQLDLLHRHLKEGRDHTERTYRATTIAKLIDGAHTNERQHTPPPEAP